MTSPLTILGRMVQKAGRGLLPTATSLVGQGSQPFYCTIPIVQQLASRGLQHRANPQRRCKYCYVVYEDERKWVFCDKHPRHKTAQLMPKKMIKNSMIMTHATNGGPGHMEMWTQQGMREDY